MSSCAGTDVGLGSGVVSEEKVHVFECVCVCACACVCVRMCVCVCACAREE